jgi:hypothetical protein
VRRRRSACLALAATVLLVAAPWARADDAALVAVVDGAQPGLMDTGDRFDNGFFALGQGKGSLRTLRTLARAYRQAVEQATAAIAAEAPSTDGGRRVQALLVESGRKRVAGMRLLERAMAAHGARASRLFGRSQKVLASAQEADDAAFEALRALRAPAAPTGP